jgi:hypothetical protein
MGAAALLGIAVVVSYAALGAVALHGFGVGGLLGFPGRAIDAIVQVNAAPFKEGTGGFGNPGNQPSNGGQGTDSPVGSPSSGFSGGGGGTGSGGPPAPNPRPQPQPHPRVI